MNIDIDSFDNWLLWNSEISQEDREIVIETILEYKKQGGN